MNHENGDNDMNGEIGANTAATLALLTDTARAGRGGIGVGGGEGGFYGGQFSGLSTIQHGIGHIEQCVRAGNENLQREFSFGSLRDMIFAQNNQMGQNMLQLTRDMADGRADSAKQAHDAAMKAAECCCETQKLVISENNETRLLVLSENSKTREDFQRSMLEEARARIVSLEANSHHRH